MAARVDDARGLPQPATVERARPAATRAATQPPHIPSLDGLRAISFFIVFAAHSALIPGMPGGFGVTVFFYLSGFLITTLLRFEQDTTGRISIRHFYLRRALRILPPFYLVLCLALAATQMGLLPGPVQGRVVAAQALHVSNYWFIWHGYDGAPAGTVPYWSLAVEEHFYLLFPCLFILLSRYLSPRAQSRAFLLICAIVCLWRCLLVGGGGITEDRTYMASDTRFDSILFGSALAVGLNPVFDPGWGSERLWKRGLLPAGLALLLVSFTYRAPWFRETIRYSVQGIGLTAVFISAIRFPQWLPFRFLNARPVAFLGVLSYTLYLVHQIAIFAVAHAAPQLAPALRAAAALTIALVIALAMHRWVERPAARMRKRLSAARA